MIEELRPYLSDRPKGSRTKVCRPLVEKILAAGPGIPLNEVMLIAMRQHFAARRYDQAAEIAAKCPNLNRIGCRACLGSCNSQANRLISNCTEAM